MGGVQNALLSLGRTSVASCVLHCVPGAIFDVSQRHASLVETSPEVHAGSRVTANACRHFTGAT